MTQKSISQLMSLDSEQFLLAVALARIKAISGEECLAMTGASQSEILSLVNTPECKALGVRIQAEGLASEVSAQLDLFRVQMKLRERLDDPDIGTSTLLGIGQFLFGVGGLKERRQVRVQEAAQQSFGVIEIFSDDSPEDVLRKKAGAKSGISIVWARPRVPVVIEAEEDSR
jgi:hypothetical protein